MRRTAVLLIAALAALAVAGGPPAPAEAAARTVSAKALLADLTVRAEDSSKRYDRSRFGYDDEYDADGDGCYTRKEVLIRDAAPLDRVSASCAVYGRWTSLYDGRATSSAGDLEIDHLVPLAEAWRSGAAGWSHRKQIAFGNDLGYQWSLQAVTKALNQGTGGGKGAQDPAEWLPPKDRCTNAKAWIGVKSRWGLTVDAAEKAALGRQLAVCDSVRVLKPGKPDLKALVGR